MQVTNVEAREHKSVSGDNHVSEDLIKGNGRETVTKDIVLETFS